MIRTGLQILAETLGDLFRRPVGDHGVDELVAPGRVTSASVKPSRFQLLT